MSFEIRLLLDQQTTESPVRQALTGIAVFDGTQWASLCREYDVASVGETAGAAFVNLQDAVREALATSLQKSLSPGGPVPDEDLRTFMLSGQDGPGPASIVRFTV